MDDQIEKKKVSIVRWLVRTNKHNNYYKISNWYVNFYCYK